MKQDLDEDSENTADSKKTATLRRRTLRNDVREGLMSDSKTSRTMSVNTLRQMHAAETKAKKEGPKRNSVSNDSGAYIFSSAFSFSFLFHHHGLLFTDLSQFAITTGMFSHLLLHPVWRVVKRSSIQTV